MVSWVVNPSSGSAPYTFTAVFKNKNLLDGVNYGFEAAAAESTISCLSDPAGGIVSVFYTSQIMANNFVVENENIPPGTCFSVAARVRNINTGQLISGLIASVDNI